MPKLFNEEVVGHPWEVGIQQLLKSGATTAAFARNLEFEPHVSPERRAICDGFVLTAKGADEAGRLNNGLRHAFRLRVRESSTPDFVIPGLNEANIVEHATAIGVG